MTRLVGLSPCQIIFIALAMAAIITEATECEEKCKPDEEGFVELPEGKDGSAKVAIAAIWEHACKEAVCVQDIQKAFHAAGVADNERYISKGVTLKACGICYRVGCIGILNGIGGPAIRNVCNIREINKEHCKGCKQPSNYE